MTRLRYDNGGLNARGTGSGLFCRMPTLNSTVAQSLRFGYIQEGSIICKFNEGSSWADTGEILRTITGGGVCSSDCGYSTGSDFYLTFVYTAYDDTNTTDYEEWIEEKKANEVEKVK